MPVFPKAELHQVRLEPDGKHATAVYRARGQTVSLTVDLPTLNALVAGCMNALRAAQAASSQLPAFSLSGPVEIDHMIPLPVDKWRVTTSDQLPGQVILHLLAAGGLYLTYSLGRDALHAILEALPHAANQAPSSKPKPGRR